MGMYLRQVCLVAHRLQPAINELTSVLGIEPCYVDPGVGRFGLENTLMPIGTNFLEVVAPVEENTAAGRFLEKRSARGSAPEAHSKRDRGSAPEAHSKRDRGSATEPHSKGDGGYILVCQVDEEGDQRRCRENAAALGIRVAYESGRDRYHLMQFHPADLKNAMWEIDWDERAEIDGVWEPAGGVDWKQHIKDDVTVKLTGVELQSDDPLATAQCWGEIADIEVESAGGVYRLSLENGELRFVDDEDGRGPGLAGVDLLVRDRHVVMNAARTTNSRRGDGCVELCGTRFYLREIA